MTGLTRRDRVAIDHAPQTAGDALRTVGHEDGRKGDVDIRWEDHL